MDVNYVPVDYNDHESLGISAGEAEEYARKDQLNTGSEPKTVIY